MLFRSSEPDRVLVDSTISMLNNQNKKIVVEGVEVYEQVELLIESGCRVAQGYYYSQPINIEEFEKLTFGKVVVK